MYINIYSNIYKDGFLVWDFSSLVMSVNTTGMQEALVHLLRLKNELKLIVFKQKLTTFLWELSETRFWRNEGE